MVLFRIIKKFGIILSRRQKVKISFLFVLMLLGGFMEVLSVSLIIPFVQAIIDSEAIMNDRRLSPVLTMLHITSTKSFLFSLAMVMAVAYLVKNAFLIFQVTIQERFVQNNQFILQRQMFNHFITMPYDYFLSANTGEIIRIILRDTNDAFLALTILLSFLSEMTVAIILSIAVFVISPVMTTVLAIVLILTALVLYAFSRKMLQRAGQQYQTAYGSVYSTLIQSFQGIKEVKLMRKEAFFQKRFDTDGRKIIKSAYINKMGTILPRNMIEAVTMCCMFFIMAGMIGVGVEINSLIPTLSGVAMASVRLLPCVNRISTSFSQLTFYEPSVNKLIENINSIEKDIKERITHLSVSNVKKATGNIKGELVAQGISYKYPTGTSFVFNNASVRIEKGQSVGIVGTSGSGKTTIVDIILGLLSPQSGTILIDGMDIREDMEWWLSQIGYIPQSIFLLEGTIRENVAFGIEPEEIDDGRVMKVLEEASLAGYIESLPDGINTQIGERGIRLSGGQRQRIGIARALYTDPEVLFFDEATSALDNETESAIMDSINRLHGTKTMIIIAHRLTTIEHCDVVYRVEDGKIVKER